MMTRREALKGSAAAGLGRLIPGLPGPLILNGTTIVNVERLIVEHVDLGHATKVLLAAGASVAAYFRRIDEANAMYASAIGHSAPQGGWRKLWRQPYGAHAYCNQSVGTGIQWAGPSDTTVLAASVQAYSGANVTYGDAVTFIRNANARPQLATDTGGNYLSYVTQPSDTTPWIVTIHSGRNGYVQPIFFGKHTDPLVEVRNVRGAGMTSTDGGSPPYSYSGTPTNNGYSTNAHNGGKYFSGLSNFVHCPKGAMPSGAVTNPSSSSGTRHMTMADMVQGVIAHCYEAAVTDSSGSAATGSFLNSVDNGSAIDHISGHASSIFGDALTPYGGTDGSLVSASGTWDRYANRYGWYDCNLTNYDCQLGSINHVMRMKGSNTLMLCEHQDHWDTQDWPTIMSDYYGLTPPTSAGGNTTYYLGKIPSSRLIGLPDTGAVANVFSDITAAGKTIDAYVTMLVWAFYYYGCIFRDTTGLAGAYPGGTPQFAICAEPDMEDTTKPDYNLTALTSWRRAMPFILPYLCIAKNANDPTQKCWGGGTPLVYPRRYGVLDHM